MGEAIITRRGGSGEVIVEFDNFIPSIDPSDEEIIHSTPTALSVERGFLAGASVGNYALFAGGVGGSGDVDTVDAYNASLTRSTPTAFLSEARRDLAGASVGNYALFAGGYSSGSYSSRVDAYDTSLTRSTPTALSAARNSLAGASVGNYALFAGGYGSYSCCDVVDAYNASLTRSTPTALSAARDSLAGASVGNYALFAGGIEDDFFSYSDAVDAYDTSLTRSTPTALSVERGFLAGASVGNYALFAGGYDDGDDDYCSYYNTVDAYNASLTRSTPTTLSVGRYNLAGASIGDYALFAGGHGSSPACKNTVDAYSLPMARLYMPIGTKYKFGESEKIATTNEIRVPVPLTGYIKFKNGVIRNG